MKILSKSLEVRLYPNKDIKSELNQHFGNVRFLWNHLVGNYSSFKQQGV